MFRGGVGSLLSGCRDLDRIDFYFPPVVSVWLSLWTENGYWPIFFAYLRKTIDGWSNHKTAIINTIYPLM